MPPRTGQKRAGTDSADAASSPRGPSKKTRFVEPADDPTNFAEQVDEALETKSRKGRVKNEGYESDSSDEGEGVVYSRRKKSEADDDDDDMFAMADKDDQDKDDSPKKKKQQYMRLGDIEGQEFNADGSEESDYEEPEDEDDAERRRKAGMGFELSSFNMREEMEEGKFTDDGSYVRSVDVHAQHDRWMEGVDEKAMKDARRRKRQHDKEQREKMEAEEKELAEAGGAPALEKDLLPYLKKGETPLEALQRLGKVVKKQKKQKSNAMDVDKSASQSAAASDVERITHLASSIMSLGDTDIYSKTYEELVRSVRSSGIVVPSWEPPSADKQYEYKWAMPGAGQTDEVFGPFAEEELQSWFKASYFGSLGEKVNVREVGEEWRDWDDIFP